MLGNVWLENAVALGLHKLPVGEAHRHNGDGYALAGHVMETVAGCSVQRLSQEQLWLPLGIKGATVTDLGGGARLNAGYIARLCQLVLNQGSCFDVELASPETCAALRPRDLSAFYPGVETEWGIGLAHRRMQVEGAADEYVLSPDLVGHVSAANCIMTIDLEHDLFVAQARRLGGRDFWPHYRQLLREVEALLPAE